MSIQQHKSRELAERKEALAGAIPLEAWMRFAGLSKRELIEAALHLAWLKSGEYGNHVGDAVDALDSEIQSLRDQGLI